MHFQRPNYGCTDAWLSPAACGGEIDCKFYVYLNPKAPQHIKDFVAEHFSDGTLVSAVFMQEMTGGLADEGPALSNYAAAFLDETGELNLLEPCIPDHSALHVGPLH
jgi:hypothetical protein